MRNWKLAVAAASANCVVIAASLGLLSWTAGGGGAAARNSARFAALIFLAGFAAPGLRRWVRFPQPATFIGAYVAAQMVHFSAVALFHGVLSKEPLKIGVPQVAVVLFGFSLTCLMGVTATSSARLGAIAHRVTLYIVFVILAADYSSHPIKSMRMFAVPVFAALAIRQLRQRTPDFAGVAAN